jgi:anti-sigma B factor antagonist
MRIQRHNNTVRISGLRELCATNAHDFREQACAALDPEVAAIEIDLSHIPFVDSSGLAALVALHKAANGGQADGGVPVCLIDPTPAVQQVIELTRMDCVFQIENRPPTSLEDSRPAHNRATPT